MKKQITLQSGFESSAVLVILKNNKIEAVENSTANTWSTDGDGTACVTIDTDDGAYAVIYYNRDHTTAEIISGEDMFSKWKNDINPLTWVDTWLNGSNVCVEYKPIQKVELYIAIIAMYRGESMTMVLKPYTITDIPYVWGHQYAAHLCMVDESGSVIMESEGLGDKLACSESAFMRYLNTGVCHPELCVYF